MANTQFTKILLLAAVGVASIFGFQGYKASNILDEKTKLQADETDSIARWRQSYKALAGSRDKWEKSFKKEDAVQDLVALSAHIGLANYGLETDSDNMVLSKVEPVSYSSQLIGLTRICMATGAGNGDNFLVAAKDYESLLKGVDSLTKRLDISVGTISLQGDKAFPIAKLGDFCVLLRN